MNKEEINFDKEKHQTEVELGIFWDIFSRALPKSRARCEIGDEKLFIAFKATFIEVRKFYKNKINKQRYERIS